jgi:chromosome segregation ATPase
VADARAAGILAAAEELQRRDDAIAAEIAGIDELAAAAAAVRERAVAVRDALVSIPIEATAVERSQEEAGTRESRAREELADAEHRLAGLEAARRRKNEEIAQARREVSTARDTLADAHSRVQRLLARRLELRDEEQALLEDSKQLAAEAAEVAVRIRAEPRVMDAGKGDPGASLDELDAWGGRARAALFVARGTLAEERERIVQEASFLVASVLGEAPAGASVALVRRRLEEALSA